MTDSPRSEVFNSRFSTPVNELDDHRNQPQHMPRAEHEERHTERRGTAGSAGAGAGPGAGQGAGGPWPPMLQLNDHHIDDGVTARDFEHVIEDGDSVEGEHEGRRSSLNPHTPIVARRSTFRRHRGTNESGNRTSRDSSLGRRSPSPPNSVEAFAEPRKRSRAGTAGTMNTLSPEDAASIRRSPSQRTLDHSRQLSESGQTDRDVDIKSDEGSVEDDVCFPAEENDKVYTIDFDDLHEFIAQKHETSPIPQPLRQKHCTCAGNVIRHGSVRDLGVDDKETSARASMSLIPGKHAASCPAYRGETEASSSEDSILNEKMDMLSKPKPVGERVNRWSFFSTEIEESIHAPELGDLLMPGENFKQLFELGPEGGCWWLDMLMPSEEEVEVICKAFGVHGLTREDIIEQETREKVELFKSYYFVCFTSFFQVDKSSENYLDPINVYAVVFREGILTFTFCQSPHAANVRKRMGRLRDYVALGADWICYALIDDIVDSFGPVIRELEYETEGIEDNVFTARPEDSREILKQIGDCRKKAMSLIRLLGGKADVIKGFAKRCNEQYSVAPRQDVGLYLSDIQDHVVTMMSNLGHFEKMLSRSHSNYLAQISVDNIIQGNKANQVLSKVTFIATILVPLNLVCGLFGMNVAVPGKNADNLDWFFGILACLIGFVLISTLIAKKFKLI